jgi:hypothetical protein
MGEVDLSTLAGSDSSRVYDIGFNFETSQPYGVTLGDFLTVFGLPTSVFIISDPPRPLYVSFYLQQSGIDIEARSFYSLKLNDPLVSVDFRQDIVFGAEKATSQNTHRWRGFTMLDNYPYP